MRGFTWGLIVLALLVSSPSPARRMVSVTVLERAGLPTGQTAKRALSAALVRSFVVFPDRSEASAPVVVIAAENQGLSDWVRAVGDDAAEHGFIAVVPEVLNRDVMQFAIAMPGSNGRAATVRFDLSGAPRLETTILASPSRTRVYQLTDHAWHIAIASLSAALDGQAQAGRGGAPGADAFGGMTSKRPDLPANFLMAAKTVAQSPRKASWIDIPMSTGTKLHTWIAYPQNVARASVVLVFQPGPGTDMREPPIKGGGANWLRAIADQLASEGFIAVLPDLTSGLGPNGGNFDSFEFPDDSARAINRISHAEVLDRIRGCARLCDETADGEREAWGDRLLYGRRSRVGSRGGNRGRERVRGVLWHPAD